MRARNRSGLTRPNRGAAAWPVALLTMLCACGSSTQAPAPSTAPTSYSIRKANLYAAIPNDICRSRNAAFLNRLAQRVSAALPPGTSSFDFVDFQAVVPKNGKAASAVVQFRTSGPDGTPVTMYAAGSFDPKTCVVGPMTGGVGRGPHDPHAKVTFSEKETQFAKGEAKKIQSWHY